jgi:signal transduction histidine kinase/ligand-binding sensor domain-containing protein
MLIGHLFGQYKNIEFDHYTTNDGLSNGYVYCITQDRKGFIWIGTTNGLNRFDGLSFNKYYYDANDTTSISSNEVTAFIEDTTGNFWIMTNRMFSLFNRKKDNFSRKLLKANNLIYNALHITCCFIDSKGFLWMASRGAIFKFKVYNNPDIHKRIIAAERYVLDEQDLEESNRTVVFNFVEDHEGKIWVASYSNQLHYFDYKTNKFIAQTIRIPDNQKLWSKQKYLLQDHEGDFYITCEWAGLIEWNRKSDKYVLYKPNGTNSAPNDDILFSIYEDLNHHIWIGSKNNGGVNIFDKKTKTFSYLKADESDAYSLSSNGINCFYKDQSGTMWIGAGNNKGINKYSPNKSRFNKYYYNPKKPEGLGFNNILSFAEGKTGDIWIGTDGGGLDKFNRKSGKFEHFLHNASNPSSLSSNIVISINVDHEGTVWAGTYNGGLVKMQNHIFSSFKNNPSNPNSINYDHVWYTLEDSKKNLWVATLSMGLDLFDRKTNKFYHYKIKYGDSTSICNNSIIQLFEDSKQNLYITTYTGVSIIDLKKYDFSKMPPNIKFKNLIHREEIKNGLSSYAIYCVAEDKNGDLWFGTMSAGIDKLERSTGKFTNYNTKDGLPGNTISSILVDDDNNLWLATDKGLAKFNPRTKNVHVFDRFDGLQNMSFHGWAMKTKDGEMFFGGPDGFNSFYPNRLQYNQSKPPIIITALKIFNKPIKTEEKINNRVILNSSISETKDLVLTHKDNFITFEFIALDYTTPQKNLYAYKMDGFDKDWIQCGTKREANYTNLDPGKYTFHVKGSNNDGIWNEKGVSLNIVVLPPWWQTIWFKIIVLSIFSLSLYIAYVLKLELFRKKQKELTVLVKQRTCEISEANNVLLDRQTRIEEYAEELRIQTENLKEANELLLGKQQLIEKQAGLLTEKNEQLNNSNQQLSLLNSTKDRFFSIIAHDLRNPFHVVSGFAEVILKEFDKLPREKTIKYIQLIHMSSTSGNNLLENLLQWSRSQTGRISFYPSTIILAAMTEEVFSLLEGDAQRKNIAIRQLIDPNITVFADENMLKTVFRNLISNAIKFTPEEGIISITAVSDVSQVEVTVADTGVGIPEDTLPLLFKIENTVTTKGTGHEIGTGLGLILCKEFVEKHNGKIWVESIEGKGSKFKFTIPFA